MSEEVILAPEVVEVEIPALSLLQMAERYPKLLGTSVAVYKDCGFARETGEAARHEVSVGINSAPGNWKRATAREAIWLNIKQSERGYLPWFDGDLRTSSEVISLLNHLNTPSLIVVIEHKAGVMSFRSSYGLDIEPNTKSIWLRKVDFDLK